MCRLMAPINLHACEATTQETVGRGSSIDLHVCGASVCVRSLRLCVPTSAVASPTMCVSLRSTRVTNAPRSQLLPITRYGVCGATACAVAPQSSGAGGPCCTVLGPCSTGSCGTELCKYGEYYGNLSAGCRRWSWPSPGPRRSRCARTRLPRRRRARRAGHEPAPGRAACVPGNCSARQ